MNTNVAASFSTETLEFLEKYYDLVHEASWLIMCDEVSRMNVYSYMNEGPSLNDEIPWWTIQTIFNTCSPLQGKKPC